MFRRSGHRFADKNIRHSKMHRACPDSNGTGHALAKRAPFQAPGDLATRKTAPARRLSVVRYISATTELTEDHSDGFPSGFVEGTPECGETETLCGRPRISGESSRAQSRVRGNPRECGETEKICREPGLS